MSVPPTTFPSYPPPNKPVIHAMMSGRITAHNCCKIPDISILLNRFYSGHMNFCTHFVAYARITIYSAATIKIGAILLTTFDCHEVILAYAVSRHDNFSTLAVLHMHGVRVLPFVYDLNLVSPSKRRPGRTAWFHFSVFGRFAKQRSQVTRSQSGL